MPSLIPSCSDEPSVAKHDWPAHNARRLVESLARLESELAPGVLAVQFSMRFRDAELALSEECRTPAWVAVESLVRSVGVVAVNFDRVFRSMERSIGGDQFTDFAAEMLSAHALLCRSIDEMERRCHTVFFDAWGDAPRPVSMQFQTPAMHSLVHFFTTCCTVLRSVVFDVARLGELRKAQYGLSGK